MASRDHAPAVGGVSHRNSEIIRLRQRGVRPRDIARRLGLTPGATNGVLHRAGLTTEPKGRGHGLPAEVGAALVAAPRGEIAAVAASFGITDAQRAYDYRYLQHRRARAA